MDINNALRPLERLLLALQADMTCPKPWGIFHITALCITFALIAFLYTRRTKHSETQLKWILGTYSIVTLILEIGKQLIWSFHYDAATQLVTWDYSWYAAPFQLCTTPMYVCLICLLLKRGAIRDTLLSYLSYITILGSIAVMIMPSDCFSGDILVTLHTTILHFGSFVVSVYLLMSREVRIHRKALISAICTFLGFACIALLMNVVIYHSGVLNGETFNMFYISPYFESSLPVFSTVQPMIPYPLFLAMYLTAISLGGCIIFISAKTIKYFSILWKYRVYWHKPPLALK